MTSEPINLHDFETAARSRLTSMALGYYRSGAHDEITLRRNQEAYQQIALRYRVLVDVSARDLSTTVLGQRVRAPMLIAPTAFHCLATADGELATVRAAGSAGTVMVVSTLSNTAIEDICQAAEGPVWFQLYVYKDRAATRGLIERAEAAGASALVLTVDAPLLGRRERDVRNEFRLPPGLSVKNLMPAGLDEVSHQLQESGLAAYFASLLDPSLSWHDIAWLRSITRLPLVIKGIVRADDARRAHDAGAAGVVVSNHGGRQLDTSVATIDVLPEIVAAVGDELEVFIDGGIRRGTDVLKALALGARAVLLGRPILWGLSVAGQAGAERVLGILAEELELAMALCGAPQIDTITRDLIWSRT